MGCGVAFGGCSPSTHGVCSVYAPCVHQQHPEHAPSMTDTTSSAPTTSTPCGPVDPRARARALAAQLGGLVVAHRRALEFAAYFRAQHPRRAWHRTLAPAHTTCAASLAVRLDATRRELAALRPSTCGARCRDGHACRAPVVRGRRRCRRHGGASTGPRTDEGRARALGALVRVNAARRAALAARGPSGEA